MKTAKEKERELIIQLHKKKRTVREIADILNIGKSTASYWINRYKQTKSLKDKPKSGKPSQLTKKQFKMIKKVLHDFPPEHYGGESMGWSTKMLLQFIKDEFNLNFGIRYAQKIMHKCGIRLITPRPVHKNASEAAKIVYRLDFKKNSKKNIWVAPLLISMKPHLD